MFCFNCTATTESYTYGHTLSLHDALPIFKVRGQVRRRGLCQGHLLGCVHRARLAPAVNDRVPPGGGLESLQPDVKQRSEEHTSELQSLMRISYAVFCLQKNKQKCTVILYLTITRNPSTTSLSHLTS